MHPSEGVHPGGAFRGGGASEGASCDRRTDACENTTFPYTPYTVGKNTIVPLTGEALFVVCI